MNYWLMKSEPEVFSIDSLQAKGKSGWDGVRNYQARNFMREGMKLGDLAFFYHSSCETPGIYGVMKISKESHPDPTQFDPKSEYYDPKASKAKPIWFMVEVSFLEKLKKPITLEQLKAEPKLKNMRLLQRGNRLSILPITLEEWKLINHL